jgi:hypothetical protein
VLDLGKRLGLRIQARIELTPPQTRKQLKEVGWHHCDWATWLHKARQMPKEDFKKAVEKELTGKETEPWEIIYFKLYQSQMPVIEKAIETAALMLGSDRSRCYCLEMICADFLAGPPWTTEIRKLSCSQ